MARPRIVDDPIKKTKIYEALLYIGLGIPIDRAAERVGIGKTTLRDYLKRLKHCPWCGAQKRHWREAR